MRRAAFTLIELLMVVLIVGILAAVAVPTYQGQKASARDAHVVERLEGALRSVRSEYATNDHRYPTEAALAAAVVADNPGGGTASPGATFAKGGVRIARVSDHRVELRSQAEDGTNFMIVDDRSADGQQTSRLRGYRGDPAGLSPIVNGMRNPGLESGVRGAWSGNKISMSTADMTSIGCWRGAWCGEKTIDTDVTGANAAITNSTGATIDVAPGDNVAVRAAVRITNGGASAIRVYVENFDPWPTQIGGTTQWAVVSKPQVGQWYNVGGIIGVTGTRASLTIRATGIQDETTFQFDDGMIVHAPAADRVPAYFDGAYGGGQWDLEGPNTGTSTGYLAEHAGPQW